MSIEKLVKAFNNKHAPRFFVAYSKTPRRGWYNLIIWDRLTGRSIGSYGKKYWLELYYDRIDLVERQTGGLQQEV